MFEFSNKYFKKLTFYSIAFLFNLVRIYCAILRFLKTLYDFFIGKFSCQFAIENTHTINKKVI